MQTLLVDMDPISEATKFECVDLPSKEYVLTMAAGKPKNMRLVCLTWY